MDLFAAFRDSNGLIYFSGQQLAPTKNTILIAVLYGCIVTVIALGIAAFRRYNIHALFTTLKWLYAGLVAVIVVTSIFSNEWLSGVALGSKLPFRSQSSSVFHGSIGLHVGLNAANITVIGNFTGVNDVYYNEQFNYDSIVTLRQNVRDAFRRGLPNPVLDMASYLGADFGEFRLARYLRNAGIFVNLMLWTAFSCWIVACALSYINMNFCIMFTLLAAALVMLSAAPHVIVLQLIAERQLVPFRTDGVQSLDTNAHIGHELLLRAGLFVWLNFFIGLSMAVFGCGMIVSKFCCLRHLVFVLFSQPLSQSTVIDHPTADTAAAAAENGASGEATKSALRWAASFGSPGVAAQLPACYGTLQEPRLVPVLNSFYSVSRFARRSAPDASNMSALLYAARLRHSLPQNTDKSGDQYLRTAEPTDGDSGLTSPITSSLPGSDSDSSVNAPLGGVAMRRCHSGGSLGGYFGKFASELQQSVIPEMAEVSAPILLETLGGQAQRRRASRAMSIIKTSEPALATVVDAPMADDESAANLQYLLRSDAAGAVRSMSASPPRYEPRPLTRLASGPPPATPLAAAPHQPLRAAKSHDIARRSVSFDLMPTICVTESTPAGL